jgi:hypothetical protein
VNKSQGGNVLLRLSNSIARLYSRKLLFFLFLAIAFFFWLFNFSSLPLSEPELKRLSNGEGLLDTRFYYTAPEAFRAMDRYGTAGRALYLRFLAFDSIFAPLYGFAFALLITRVAAGLFDPASRWNSVNLLPLAIATADVAENACLLLLLTIYPAQNRLIGTLAGIATVTKWSLAIISIGVLTILCLTAAIQRLRRGTP